MTQTASKPATKQWNKELVQEHAQTAVKVELYTLPFYLTALASIKDKKTGVAELKYEVRISHCLRRSSATSLQSFRV